MPFETPCITSPEYTSKCKRDPMTFCTAMDQVLDLSPSHTKGLSCFTTTNFRTDEMKTWGVIFKKNAKDGGLLLNTCPWCGENINWSADPVLLPTSRKRSEMGRTL